jgi:hypothetical protein
VEYVAGARVAALEADIEKADTKGTVGATEA